MCLLGRLVVSLFLFAVGFALLVLIQWISWHGPELLQMHYGSKDDPDNLGISFIIAAPLLSFASAAFFCAGAVLSEPQQKVK